MIKTVDIVQVYAKSNDQKRYCKLLPGQVRATNRDIGLVVVPAHVSRCMTGTLENNCAVPSIDQICVMVHSTVDELNE